MTCTAYGRNQEGCLQAPSKFVLCFGYKDLMINISFWLNREVDTFCVIQGYKESVYCN